MSSKLHKIDKMKLKKQRSKHNTKEYYYSNEPLNKSSIPAFEQAVWRVELDEMHDESVFPAELVVALREDTAERNVHKPKHLSDHKD